MLLLLNELEIANSKMKTSELVALSAHVSTDLYFLLKDFALRITWI